MDMFGVPKIINRHVLKALYSHKSADIYQIYDLVEISMRNNVPVKNRNGAIRKCLENMVKVGIVVKDGSKFYPCYPRRVKRKLFGAQGHGQEFKSDLDPNLRRNSRNKYNKTLRYSTVRPLKRAGRKVLIPKSRRNRHNKEVMELGQNYNSYNESYDNEEFGRENAYSVSKLFKSQCSPCLCESKMLQPQIDKELSEQKNEQNIGEINEGDGRLLTSCSECQPVTPKKTSYWYLN